MPAPARVCFVVENLLPAGTELWIVRLIERLDRSRVEPFLCLLDGENELSTNLIPDNCKTLCLGMKSICSRHGLRSGRRFYRWLKHNDIQIVQVHHADPTYFGVPIAKLAGVKKILQTKYDLGYWLTFRDLWLHRLARRFVDLTVANCRACQVAATEQEWAPRNGVVVVDNGISIDRLAEIEPLNMTDAQQVNVGMVCNLRSYKDPFVVVQAAKSILTTRDNVHFHIAGDGEMFSQVQRHIDEANLTERFTIHGAVEYVLRFLESMHISVLCS